MNGSDWKSQGGAQRALHTWINQVPDTLVHPITTGNTRPNQRLTGECNSNLVSTQVSCSMLIENSFKDWLDLRENAMTKPDS